MLQLSDTRADVWYAWVDDCDQHELDIYESLLNPEERERLRRFAFPFLKREYLVTRALCRFTLSRYAAVAPRDWAFVQNRYGRPEIHPGFGTRLRFNLSNCRSLVACIVTREADAGIDVESLDRPSELLSLADRYFSAAEVRLLRATPPEEQRDCFLQLWTLKEAYIKARGMGLAIPLEQFSFDLRGTRIRVSFDPVLRERPAAWQFTLYRVGDRHRMAIGIHNVSTADLTIEVREGLLSLRARRFPGQADVDLRTEENARYTFSAEAVPTIFRASAATSPTLSAVRNPSACS